MKWHRLTTALLVSVFSVGGGIAAAGELAAAQEPSLRYETVTVPRGTEF